MSASARQEFSPEQRDEEHFFCQFQHRARKAGHELDRDPEGGYRFTGGGGLWTAGLDDIGKVDSFLLALLVIQRCEEDGGKRHIAWAARKAGSQKALAERLGISPSYVSDMIAGKRDVPARILEKLGLRAVVSYVRTGS